MRVYARVGLRTGIPFGILMALWNSGTRSPARFIALALVYGVIFGVLMAAVLGTRHRRMTRGSDTTSGSRADDALTLPLSVAEARDLCANAAQALRKGRLKSVDERRVELTAGASLNSWGERVSLDLAATPAGSTLITITSRSALRLTVVDYGKNRDNVDRITEWLQRQASVRAVRG